MDNDYFLYKYLKYKDKYYNLLGGINEKKSRVTQAKAPAITQTKASVTSLLQQLPVSLVLEEQKEFCDDMAPLIELYKKYYTEDNKSFIKWYYTDEDKKITLETIKEYRLDNCESNKIIELTGFHLSKDYYITDKKELNFFPLMLFKIYKICTKLQIITDDITDDIIKIYNFKHKKFEDFNDSDIQLLDSKHNLELISIFEKIKNQVNNKIHNDYFKKNVHSYSFQKFYNTNEPKDPTLFKYLNLLNFINLNYYILFHLKTNKEKLDSKLQELTIFDIKSNSELDEKNKELNALSIELVTLNKMNIFDSIFKDKFENIIKKIEEINKYILEKTDEIQTKENEITKLGQEKLPQLNSNVKITEISKNITHLTENTKKILNNQEEVLNIRNIIDKFCRIRINDMSCNLPNDMFTSILNGIITIPNFSTNYTQFNNKLNPLIYENIEKYKIFIENNKKIITDDKIQPEIVKNILTFIFTTHNMLYLLNPLKKELSINLRNLLYNFDFDQNINDAFLCKLVNFVYENFNVSKFYDNIKTIVPNDSTNTLFLNKIVKPYLMKYECNFENFSVKNKILQSNLNKLQYTFKVFVIILIYFIYWQNGRAYKNIYNKRSIPLTKYKELIEKIIYIISIIFYNNCITYNVPPSSIYNNLKDETGDSHKVFNGYIELFFNIDKITQYSTICTESNITNISRYINEIKKGGNIPKSTDNYNPELDCQLYLIEDSDYDNLTKRFNKIHDFNTGIQNIQNIPKLPPQESDLQKRNKEAEIKARDRIAKQKKDDDDAREAAIRESLLKKKKEADDLKKQLKKKADKQRKDLEEKNRQDHENSRNQVFDNILKKFIKLIIISNKKDIDKIMSDFEYKINEMKLNNTYFIHLMGFYIIYGVASNTNKSDIIINNNQITFNKITKTQIEFLKLNDNFASFIILFLNIQLNNINKIPIINILKYLLKTIKELYKILEPDKIVNEYNITNYYIGNNGLMYSYSEILNKNIFKNTKINMNQEILVIH